MHRGEDERLGMLYLRRDNRHQVRDPESEPWLKAERAGGLADGYQSSQVAREGRHKKSPLSRIDLLSIWVVSWVHTR